LRNGLEFIFLIKALGNAPGLLKFQIMKIQNLIHTELKADVKNGILKDAILNSIEKTNEAPENFSFGLENTSGDLIGSYSYESKEDCKKDFELIHLYLFKN